MNYEKHYTLLIEKGKVENNISGAYYEKHHIIPRCIGGGDEEENLVKLTPEQHCVAHLLLVKIYPEHPKLYYAARLLYNTVRNNKEYGWVKRKCAKIDSDNKMGVSRSKESCKKQSETMRRQYKEEGRINNRKGCVLSNEHKEAISKGNAGKIIKEESKSNLKGYILRYGEIEGTKLYKEHSKKKALTLEIMIEKYGEDKGKIEWDKMNSKKALHGEDNGFYGKTHSDETKALISQKQKENSASKGKIWVNNGETAIRVFENEIPQGFVKGRGKRNLKAKV